MCGLFGTIRPVRYGQNARRASAAVIHDLGGHAEERGIDSAGIAALRSSGRDTADNRSAPADASGWQIVTALGAYREHLPSDPELRTHLRLARVVLGHTRWATQGPPILANASPMEIGDIIGTHNGDVSAPPNRGVDTDSAWLFGRLDRAQDRSGIALELTALRGRAALAWTRRSRPGLLYLARAALSPLATAVDQHGALWWASNPAWLRKIGAERGLKLSEPILMSEGEVIVLHSGAEQVTLVDQFRFIPTSRPRDDWTAATTCFRGFSAADRTVELSRQNHRVESSDFLERAS